MKKVIALATLMTTAFASAQTNNELSFGDLNYFLKQGQFNLATDIGLDRNEFSEDQGGAKSTTESEAYVLDYRGGYGLADNLNLVLGLSYLHDYDFNTEPRAPGAHYSQNGLANPTLAANYRLMNQRSSAYNWDIGAVAKIQIQDAESGSFAGGHDGNAATGNHALELNTSVGRKWNEANEWRLTAGAQYNMEGEFTEVGNSDVENDTGSSVDMFLRGTYQYRPVNEFMLAVGLQATRVGERENDTTNQGPLNATSTFESHINYDLTFAAKYLITENFIGKFNYGQSRLADIDVDTTVDSQIQRRRHQYYGLGVDFLF